MRRLPNMAGSLCARQDLPEEAFVSLTDLRSFPAGGLQANSLPVVAISHPWLCADMPDPNRTQACMRIPRNAIPTISTLPPELPELP